MPTALLGLLLLLQQAPAGLFQNDPDEPGESDPVVEATQEQEAPRYGISADFDWSFSNSEKSPLDATFYGDNLLSCFASRCSSTFRLPTESASM